MTNTWPSAVCLFAMGAALRYEPFLWSSPSCTSSFHRRAIRPLGVGASVGADCSRMPNIGRYWATATVPGSVLRQHAMKAADTQRNSPPLVTDQKVGGSSPSGRALLRQTIQAPDQRKRKKGSLSCRMTRQLISRCGPSGRLRLGSSASGQPLCRRVMARSTF